MSPEGIGVGIVGIGAYLPEHVRPNSFWPREWREAHAARARADLATGVDEAVRARSFDVDPEVARATVGFAEDLFRGSIERRVIGEGQLPSDLEVLACEAAIADSGVDRSEIDAYYGYSQVPDSPSPVNHGRVHQRLGLRRDSSAATLDVGCASFLPQLVTASRMIQCGEAHTALIAVSSALSLITDYDAPSSVNGGDGAVAAVIRKVEPGFGYIGQCQKTRGELHQGIVLAAKGHPDVPWYRGDIHQAALTAQNLDRRATHTMGAHAASMCREVCHELLERYDLRPADVDFFATAQATAWFAEALCEAVGVPQDRRLPVDAHYARFGHLVPGSLPLNVFLAYRAGRLKKGDLVLMFSPGAGYTQAATLYRWNLETPRA
jgi:3-oxoacyl-[acyl-carrier-protein] synthase-3